MKIQLLLTGICLCFITLVEAQIIPISDARALPVGSTVTVNGNVTSGIEFGTIRYIQDGTAGIAVFSTSLAAVQRGDNITVTGVLTQFNNLLELAPVTSVTINSSGDPDPAPLVLTPSQMNESNESMLVRVNNVTFTTTGTFQSNGTYNILSNGEPGVIFIRSSNPLVGSPIPTSTVSVYGINSQYGSQYQLLPRNANDIIFSSVISIIQQPTPFNISTSAFDINWKTDMSGNGFLRYGLTPALELGTLNGPSNATNCTVNISGCTPATVYYVQSYSVSGTDTAFSGVKPFITASNSSGVIKAYFDRPVDNSAAIPGSNLAISIPNLFDDTLKAFIDRVTTTLDIAMYTIDDSGTALVIQAINDAWNRGVRVRIVTEGGNTNAGLALLNPAIPVQLSPTTAFYYGIMHNKFFVGDANDADPNKPVVMTGSTNWSNQQLYTDRNNLLFIQDQALARVYTMEFEEMWGGNGNFPVPSNMKFGPDKTDNTPHILNIAGKKVESYFSPSDNTNTQIINTVGTADTDLFFATMVFTRYDIAYAMEDRIVNHGVNVAGIVNDSSNGSGTSFLILQGVIGNNMLLFDHASQPGILHHKYMIVDHGNFNSDPLVLTGSHNWSSAATQKNDENTLIIHDALIANQYYQEFHSLYNTSGGALGLENNIETSGKFLVYPNPSNGKFSVVYSSEGNDDTNISISDITGRVVFELPVNSSAGLNEVVIDQQFLSKGVYFVRVGEENTTNVMRLIIF
jgi:DNA/RNA endonuclease YhcR with UshA esterase domain